MGLMDLSNETELGGPRFFVITSKPLSGIRRLEKLRLLVLVEPGLNDQLEEGYRCR